MKAFILTFFSFLIILNVSLAQEKTQRSRIGVHVTANTTKAIFVNVFEGVERENGTLRAGGGLGLDYFYQLSEQISLKTGINYSYVQFSEVNYSPIFLCDLNPLTGLDNHKHSWFEGQYKLHYFGIPVEALLKLSDHQNHFYTRVGMEAQLKIRESPRSFLVECLTTVTERSHTEDTKNTLFLLNFGIGYQFQLSSGRDVYFEPELSYTMNKVFTNLVLKRNIQLLTLGIRAGVKF